MIEFSINTGDVVIFEARADEAFYQLSAWSRGISAIAAQVGTQG